MFRAICALTTASLIVGVTTLAAQPSRTGEAGVQRAMVADHLDGGEHVSNCSLHGWPYYKRECLRDDRQAGRQARPVRLVGTDRLPPATSTAPTGR